MLQVQEKQLVYINNDKPATDSITIAETFEKGHAKVLRDIRQLECSEEFRLANFGQSSYVNKQGRTMPMFIVSFDGFAMLGMGYTGKRAMEFKERYINEFNRTRQILDSQKNEQVLLGQSNDSTLFSDEQNQIQALVGSVIYYLFPTSSNYAKRKFFSRLYCDLRERYNVRSYRDIRRADLEDALKFIRQWMPTNYL